MRRFFAVGLFVVILAAPAVLAVEHDRVLEFRDARTRVIRTWRQFVKHFTVILNGDLLSPPKP